MEKYKGSAWKIMAAMMCIQAGSLGILMNCNGILFSAVIRDLGFRAGDLSLYYTIRSLVTAFFVTTTTRLVFEKKSNVVMAILGCFYTLPYLAMFSFSKLWQFYIAGALTGIGMSCTMTVIPMVLNNWFRTKNGMVIGLTVSASGVAGALFSPVCSRLIVNFGWRATAVIMGVIGFCLIVLPAFFFLIPTPEEAGERPYGASEAVKEEKKDTESGMKRVLPLSVFIMTLVAILGPGSLVQFNQQLSTYAQTIGYTIETGALLTSLSMIGNLTGKMMLGALADRIGVYRAMLVFLAVCVCAMTGYLTLSASRPALLVTAMLYGTVYSIGMTTPSLLYLDLYGKAGYREKLSRMQAVNSVSGAVFGAVFPYMYDLTGSFRPVFIYGIAVCVISAFMVTRLRKISASLN